MKAISAALLLSIMFMLKACDRTPHDPLLHVRVSELRDSLKVYMDSLSSVQKFWTFNMLTPVVSIREDELRLGDTCMATIRVAAANDWDNGYQYDTPKLLVSAPPSSDRSLVVNETKYSWQVSFIPDRLGEDSLTGAVYLSTPGTQDSVKLRFSTRFKVRPR